MQFSLTTSTAMMKCSYLKSQSHPVYWNAWHILAYLGICWNHEICKLFSTTLGSQTPQKPRSGVALRLRLSVALRLIAPLEHLAAQEETVIRDQEPSGRDAKCWPSGAELRACEVLEVVKYCETTENEQRNEEIPND